MFDQIMVHLDSISIPVNSGVYSIKSTNKYLAVYNGSQIYIINIEEGSLKLKECKKIENKIYSFNIHLSDDILKL